MFFKEISLFLFYIKSNMGNKLGYRQEKDQSIDLKELNWKNVESGFKIIMIRNTKNFVLILHNKAFKLVIRMYYKQYK